MSKELKPHPKLLKKTQLAMLMCNNGEDPEYALKLVNGKDTISPRAVANLKEKCKKYSLQAKPMAHLAHNQIKRILKGEPREVTQEKLTKDGTVVEFTERVSPTDTNILSAAMMVYDRYEPVDKGEVEGGDTYNTYIDLSGYRNHGIGEGGGQNG